MKLKIITEDSRLVGFDELISETIRLRVKASKLEAEAKELKETANGMFSTMSEATAVDKVETNQGTLSMVTRKTAHVDMETLKSKLLQSGVDSDVLKRAIDNSTSEKTSTSVGFYPIREERGKEKAR